MDEERLQPGGPAGGPQESRQKSVRAGLGRWHRHEDRNRAENYFAELR